MSDKNYSQNMEGYPKIMYSPKEITLLPGDILTLKDNLRLSFVRYYKDPQGNISRDFVVLTPPSSGVNDVDHKSLERIFPLVDVLYVTRSIEIPIPPKPRNKTSKTIKEKLSQTQSENPRWFPSHYCIEYDSRTQEVVLDATSKWAMILPKPPSEPINPYKDS